MRVVPPPPSHTQDTYTDYKVVCMPDLSPLLPEDEAHTTFLSLTNQEYNATILCPPSVPGSKKMCGGGGMGVGGASGRAAVCGMWEGSCYSQAVYLEGVMTLP